MAKSTKKAAKSKPAAKKTPPRPKAAAPARKPPARAATGRPAARGKSGKAVDWQERLSELRAGAGGDSELFHGLCLLIDQAVGAAFINLFVPNGDGVWELVGAHEKTVSYYRDPEEKHGPVLDSTRALPSASEPAIASHPDQLPLFGIEPGGPKRVAEAVANSALLVPFGRARDRSGLLVVAGQEPQPHYTQSQLDLAAGLAAVLGAPLEKHALHCRLEKAAAAQRELKKSADEALVDRDTVREELERARSGHAEEIARLRADAADALQEARRRLDEERTAEITALRQQHKAELERAERVAAEAQSGLDARLAEQREQLLSAARADSEQALHRLQEDAAARARATEEKHSGEISRLREQHENQVRELQTQLERTRADLSKDREGRENAEQQVQTLQGQHAQQMQREKAEIEELFSDEIQSLTTKLQNETRERAQESQAYRERLDAAGKELEETRRTLERTQGALQETIQNSRDFEQRLSAANQELARIRADHTKELGEVRGQLESERNAAKQRDGSAAQVQQNLQVELAETKKHLEDYRSTYEETKANFQRQIAQSTEKQEELRQTLEKERRAADSERSTLQARVEELSNALQQRETDLLAEKHRITETLTAREKELEALRSRVPELEARLRDATQAVQEADEKGRQSHAQIESLGNERDELQLKVKRLEKDLEREATRLAEEVARHEESVQRERAQAEAAAADLRTRTNAAEGRASEAARDLENARTEIERLRGTLTQGARERETLSATLSERTASLEKAQTDLGHQSLRVEKLTAELDEARATESDLRSQIGIHRDREARLEQAVASMREQGHAQKSEIAKLNERLRELERSLDSQLERIAALNADLTEEQGRVKKLEDELRTALAREKGSRETGNLIAHITNAISNIVGLSPKLDFLRKRALPDRAFDRVLLFSLLDDAHLRFEDGYQGDKSLAEHRGLRIPLRVTNFGEAIASGHAIVQSSGKKDPPHPDLAGVLGERLAPEAAGEAVRTLIYVPLREAEKVVGLLSFASTSAAVPNQSRVELLEQLAPLIAVSLRFEQNRAELEHEHRVRGYADHVNRYLEGRFVSSARRLHRLAGVLGPVAQGAREEVAQDLLTDVQAYADAVVPSLDRADGPEELVAWLRLMASRAESKAALTATVQIDEPTLAALQKRLGGRFHNLFWIIEEAVENVIRHSKAKRLWLSIAPGDGSLCVSVSDDGDGLMRTAGTMEPKHGTGLPAIRNLLGNCGGELHLGKAENGYGLALVMSWPLAYRES